MDNAWVLDTFCSSRPCSLWWSCLGFEWWNQMWYNNQIKTIKSNSMNFFFFVNDNSGCGKRRVKKEKETRTPTAKGRIWFSEVSRSSKYCRKRWLGLWYGFDKPFDWWLPEQGFDIWRLKTMDLNNVKP